MPQSIYFSLFLSSEKPVPCNETVACASGTTCCKTEGGTWACCPLPQVGVCIIYNLNCFNTLQQTASSNAKAVYDVFVSSDLQAVCCEDHAHCCPKDTVCNLPEGTCDDPADLSVSVPWVTKVPTFTLALSDQKCDETSSCPDDSTCCKLPSGKWGCCPMPMVRVCV